MRGGDIYTLEDYYALISYEISLHSIVHSGEASRAETLYVEKVLIIVVSLERIICTSENREHCIPGYSKTRCLPHRMLINTVYKRELGTNIVSCRESTWPRFLRR